MTPFVVGIVLIVGGIAFAAAPLLRKKSRVGGAHQEPRPERPVPTARTPREVAGAALQLAESAPAVPGPIAMALEELELDRAMGKLSERDYEDLRATLLRESAAAAATRMSDALPANASTSAPPPDVGAHPEPLSAPIAARVPGLAPELVPSAATPSSRDLDAEAEQLVRSAGANMVSCPDCGPRPEPGAPFCSNCGRALGACPNCGAKVAASGARFCDRCGSALTR